MGRHAGRASAEGIPTDPESQGIWSFVSWEFRAPQSTLSLKESGPAKIGPFFLTREGILLNQ